MSDKERLENMSPIGIDLNGNVLLKGKDYHWLLEQVEHRQKLLERLNKRGIEIKKLKKQLCRCREKIKNLEWNLLITKGTADQSMRANKSNYELANKLKEENKRYREALNSIITLWIASTDATDDTWLAHEMSETARKALEGEQ